MARTMEASSEEESTKFLVSPVVDYITPTSNIVSLSEEDTANVAISVMKRSGIRHVVIADKVKDKALLEDSKVVGVILCIVSGCFALKWAQPNRSRRVGFVCAVIWAVLTATVAFTKQPFSFLA